MNEQEMKKATAKLYNFKSYLDGKVQEVNAGLVSTESLCDGVSMMANNFVEGLVPSST